MYSVLLVDDEKPFLDYLQKTIDWEKHNCQINATATDGEEALRLILELKPDIVFLDINMSRMSGLEVCKQLSASSSALPHIIISTAHDQFSYAHEAIKLGVFDYLLKPVEPGELSASINKCIFDIEEQKDSLKSKAYYRDAQTEKFFQRIIELHNVDAPPDFLKLSQTVAFSVSIVKTVTPDERIIHILVNRMNQLTDSLMTSYFTSFSASGYVITHVFYQDMSLADFRQAYEYIASESSMLTSATFGNRVTSLDQLYKSYQQAQIAMENQIQFDQRVVSYDDLESLDFSSQQYSESDINLLISCLKSKQYDEADKIIERILTLSDNNIISFQFVVAAYCSIKTAIYRHFNVNNSLITEHMLAQSDILRELNTCQTTREITEIVKNYVHEIFSDCMDYPISNKQRDLIDRAETILQKNYQRPDFSVNDLSQALFFESSYIRRVYKAHTGKTIIQRLEEIRIEKACSLLAETSLKLSEIAEKAGYSNQFYFSRRFKLFTNMTPSEYREQH